MRHGNDVIGILYESSWPGAGGSQPEPRPPPPEASAAQVTLPRPGTALSGATSTDMVYVPRKSAIASPPICRGW